MSIILKIIGFCILLVFSSAAFSAESTSASIFSVDQRALAKQKLPKVPVKANQVYFGVYPIALYDFDMDRGTFKVGYYAWWRTQDKNYHPSDSVEITNAESYYSKFGGTGRGKNEYYTYVHYYATIHHQWNVVSFPFDRQFLVVHMEDFYDIQHIYFVPDVKNSNLHSELQLKGWDIMGMRLKHSVMRYDTNLGDSSVERGFYSRLSFIIEIKRHGWRPFFDYYIGFFVAAFLCLMMYLSFKEKFSGRVGMGMSAIFAFVGNKYVLGNLLPFTTEFTLSDIIQTATLMMIITTIANCILLDIILTKRQAKLHRKLDYGLAFFSAVIYIAVISYFTYRAVIS